MKTAIVLTALVLSSLVAFAEAPQIKKASQPGMPIEIASVSMTVDKYRGEVVYAFKVNDPNVESFDVAVVVVRGGVIKAGEVFQVLDGNSVLSHQLQLHPADDDIVETAVVRTVTRSETKSLGMDRIPALISGTLEDGGKAESSSPLFRFTCAQAYVLAGNSCGTAGIHSFSCNESTQSFSFTCN